MDLKECKIIIMAGIERGNKVPSAMVITIAPSEKEAIELAKEEFKKVGVNEKKMKLQLRAEDSILFPPVTTTVFLYVPGAGRIK